MMTRSIALEGKHYCMDARINSNFDVVIDVNDEDGNHVIKNASPDEAVAKLEALMDEIRRDFIDMTTAISFGDVAAMRISADEFKKGDNF